MALISDKELFNQIQDGKKELMELIVHRYYKDIFRYIYGKIRDYYLAQDLCQDTFCKVYQKRATFRGGYPLRPWIYRIAKNCIIDYYRSKGRKEQNHYSLSHHQVQKQAQAENVIEYKILENDMDTVLQDLNDLQQEVIRLRFYHDLSINDIAIITDTNPNTVKSRLYQGIRHLKSKLKGEYGGEPVEGKAK